MNNELLPIENEVKCRPEFSEEIDIHPFDVCPKCGNDYLFVSFFSEPDHLGIDAMVVHSKKVVHGVFGSYETSGKKCFISTKEVGIKNPNLVS